MTTSLLPPSLLAHVNPAAYTMKPASYRPSEDALNLSTNEFIHPAVDRLHRDALNSVPESAVHKYTMHPELLADLAAYLRLSEECLVLTAGFSDALKLICTAMFVNSKRVVVARPGFGERYPMLLGLDVRPVRIHQDGSFDIDDFIDTLGEQSPSAILISNPNGPTGFCLPYAEIDRLARFTHQHGHLLVVDEVYSAYSGFDHVSLVGAYDNVLVVRSFSKSFGLAGARAAVIAAQPHIVDYLVRWIPGNTVSAVTGHVLRYLLRHESEIVKAREEIIATRQWFVDWVARHRPTWRTLPSGGNFAICALGDLKQADRVVARLADNGVLIRSMSEHAPLSDCLRFGICDRLRMETVTALLDAESVRV